MTCRGESRGSREANWVLSMMTYRGYICICLPAERLAELDIKMMVEDNQEKHRTAYTVTCDYKYGELLSWETLTSPLAPC